MVVGGTPVKGLAKSLPAWGLKQIPLPRGGAGKVAHMYMVPLPSSLCQALPLQALGDLLTQHLALMHR